MPPTDTPAGDSRRDPRVLLVLAALLLAARVALTAWDYRHEPPAPAFPQGGFVMPGPQGVSPSVVPPASPAHP